MYHLYNYATSLPEMLIINTGDIGDLLHHKLTEHQFLLNDPDTLMSEILSSVSFQKNAELELSYRLLEEGRNNLGNVFEKELEEIINLANAFGTALINTLTIIGAYNDGYLYYSFDSWNGPDIVLTKLQVPEIV